MSFAKGSAILIYFCEKLFSSIFIGVILPIFAGAHGATGDFDDIQTVHGTMESNRKVIPTTCEAGLKRIKTDSKSPKGRFFVNEYIRLIDC